MNKQQLLKQLKFEKTYNNLSELEKDKSYVITSMELKKTKFGELFSVDLENGMTVFLPARFTPVFKQKGSLDAVKNEGMKLIYKGMRVYEKTGKPMHDVDFE